MSSLSKAVLRTAVLSAVLSSFYAPGLSLAASDLAGKVWDVSASRWKTLEQLSDQLSTEFSAHGGTVVLSEKHDTTAVQLAQARVIQNWSDRNSERLFTVAWEFLASSRQAETQAEWQNWNQGKITGEEFLDRIFGPGRERFYLPILAAAKNRGAQLLGVNLTRAEKAPILKGGLSALDPSLLPPGFKLGSAGYRERFERDMAQIPSGHATPEKIQNYYEAQCVTDEVMADRLLRYSQHPMRFLVVGSFHADFGDGVVARIRERSQEGAQSRAKGPEKVQEKLHVIRFVDVRDYTKEELDAWLKPDPRYGNVADDLIFVDSEN